MPPTQIAQRVPSVSSNDRGEAGSGSAWFSIAATCGTLEGGTEIGGDATGGVEAGGGESGGDVSTGSASGCSTAGGASALLSS